MICRGEGGRGNRVNGPGSYVTCSRTHSCCNGIIIRASLLNTWRRFHFDRSICIELYRLSLLQFSFNDLFTVALHEMM